MEYKLKENVNVNSLTFRKKVLEETIDLLGAVRNYTETTLKFNLMLGFLDNILEGNTLLEELAKSTRLLDEIEGTIEPLFESAVLGNDDYLQAFNSISQELIEYADREMINNRTITGLLYAVLDEVGSLTVEEIATMINQMVGLAANKFIPTQKEVKSNNNEKTLQTTKDKDISIIEDKKMLELIEKFKGQENITK